MKKSLNLSFKVQREQCMQIGPALLQMFTIDLISITSYSVGCFNLQCDIMLYKHLHVFVCGAAVLCEPQICTVSEKQPDVFSG